MRIAQSVADVLRDHMVLEYEAIDRIPQRLCAVPAGSPGPVASTTVVMPMTEAFVRNIEQFTDNDGH